MRALTIRQPWADAIVHSTKRVECRSWRTAYRGPVLVHAAARADVVQGVPRGLPDVRSAVLATAELTDCHQCPGTCSQWADPATWHWVLEDVQALPVPVPTPGRLGLWRPDPDLLTQVRTQ